MKSLAIVSSYNELCGNATYTHALKKEFAKHFDVDVIPLKTRLLRSKYKEVIRAGHEHIEELARKLRDYDYVNIQFEAGLYGSKAAHIIPRISKLIKGSPNLIFTMHRVDFGVNSALWDLCRKFNPLKPKRSLKAWVKAREINTSALTTSALVNDLKQASSRKNVWLLVHTKRDSELLRLMYNFDRVIDYPLTYLNEVEQIQYQKVIDPATFNSKYNLPADAKTIGVFGFLNRYKGFESVIQSLDNLPTNHHLLIFGSQHPLSIEPNKQVDPYIKRLMALAQKESVSGRVHFLGSVDDESFLTALSSCHRVVLPYLEVGQGMSAIAVLALELRAKALYANNLAVLELLRYAPNTFPTFDIGNHLELANKINNYQWSYAKAIDRYTSQYNIAANIQMQIELFEGRAALGNGVTGLPVVQRKRSA